MKDASKTAPCCFRKRGRTYLISYKRVAVPCWVGGKGYHQSERYHVWNLARVSERPTWKHGLPPEEEAVMLTRSQFFTLTEAGPKASAKAVAFRRRQRERSTRRRHQKRAVAA